MTYDTTEQAAQAVLKVIENEGQRLYANLTVERTEKRSKSNEMVVSLKKQERTFRITFNWVRDENVPVHGFGLGNGYIETEWDLQLRPTKPAFPVVGPFAWYLEPRDESIARTSHPHTLEESWLRQLIRKKLATEHVS